MDILGLEAELADNLLLGGVATRFVNIDRDTALLLPPDTREWVPADHLVHFVLDALGVTRWCVGCDQ